MDTDETNPTPPTEAIEEYKPELPSASMSSQNATQDQENMTQDQTSLRQSLSPDYLTRLLAWVNENHTLVIIGLSLLVLVEIIWGYSVISSTQKKVALQTAIKTQTQKPSTNPVFTLGVSPAEVAVGKIATFSATLDTKNVKTDGATMKITYDPTRLQYVGVKNGTTYPDKNYTKPVVDQKRGTVTVSADAGPSSTFQGAGIFASVAFKTLKSGATKVDFVFHKDNPDATAVAALGKQVLESVSGTAMTIR